MNKEYISNEEAGEILEQIGNISTNNPEDYIKTVLRILEKKQIIFAE